MLSQVDSIALCLKLGNGHAFTSGRGNEGQLGALLTKYSENTTLLKISDKDEKEEKLCCYLCEVRGFGYDNKASLAACGEKFTLILNGKDKRIV